MKMVQKIKIRMKMMKECLLSIEGDKKIRMTNLAPVTKKMTMYKMQ